MNPYLSVIAEIEAKPGCEDRVRDELKKMTAATRQENGCVQYDLHESTVQPGQFWFYENWTTPEALDAHSRSAHIQAFRAIAPELLARATRVVTCRRVS